MFYNIYLWFIFFFYGCVSIAILVILTHVMLVNYLYFIKLLPKNSKPHIGTALLLTVFCVYLADMGMKTTYALPYIRVEIIFFVFEMYLILDALAAIKLFLSRRSKNI